METEQTLPSLKERIEQYNSDSELDFVKLDQGESVLGQILEIDFRSAKFDDHVPVLTLQLEDDEVVELWCHEVVLRNEIEKREPQPGQHIGVKRLRDALKPDGSLAYKRFRVFDERPREVNWTAQKKLPPEAMPRGYQEPPDAENGTGDAFEAAED